jgi:phosphate transport system substrate-binding protein
MFNRFLRNASVAVGLLATTVSAQTVTVAGSSTVRPVMDQAVEAFKSVNPDVKFVVGSGGSSTGVKAAANGEVMIGMASRALTDKERQSFPDLQAHQIAVDGVAMFVNKKNGVSGLTKVQVQKMYTGEFTNWSQLGGNDEPIFLVSKTENHGTHDMFLKYFDLESETTGQGKDATMRFRVKGTDAWGSVTSVATDENKDTFANVLIKGNAVGYAGVGNVETMASKSGGRLSLLSLDGVQASSSTVADGSYPLVRPLQLLTKGDPEGVVAEFIAFINGPQGSKIISGLDFIPTGGTATASAPTD